MGWQGYDNEGDVRLGPRRDVTKAVGRLVHCLGCGSDVEPVAVGEFEEFTNEFCLTCQVCIANPALRESYRRGYNDALDDFKRAVVDMVDKSNLRKWPPKPDEEE